MCATSCRRPAPSIPDDNFRMKYEIIERNAKHVDAIAKAVKDADTVLLATDPDREGEAIAWHLSEILKGKRVLKDKTLKRVVFYEITEGAVKDAVKNPRDISMELVNAQQARRALDYLVGFNLSPCSGRRSGGACRRAGCRARRLRLIVEREIEIENFKTREYWSIHFDSEKAKTPFTAKLTHFRGEKLDQFSVGDAARNAEVTGFLETHAKGVARVSEIEKKRKLRSPAPPFTTSTLQQEAVRKLGFSTDRAMKVAQASTKASHSARPSRASSTYMRTDSVSLSKEAVSEIRGYITKNYGSDYLRRPRSPTRAPRRTRRKPTRPSARPRSRAPRSPSRPTSTTSSASSTR